MSFWQSYRYQIILAFLGIVFFLPFLGGVHLFDWDEINFAESSREMLTTGNFFQVQINYEPFMEKPPLFFWLQSISMTLFGVNEFAARFPNAFFGVLALLTLFKIGKELKGEKFGLIWSLIYFGSFLPNLYYKSGIIDPVFNYFIFLSVYYIIRLTNERNVAKQNGWAIKAGIFNGLAIITKGPVGLLLLLLTVIVMYIKKGFKPISKIKHIIIFAFTAFFITTFWYGYEVVQRGPWFLVEFIKYQAELFSKPVAGHEQPFFYHFLVVFLGCFPMSVFALPVLFKKDVDKYEFQSWMKSLFWVVMILFTIVTTKIVHYSSMAYLPLSYLAASFLFQLDLNKIQIKTWMKIIFYLIGGIFSILLISLPYLLANKETLIIPHVTHPFTLTQLNIDLNLSGFEGIIGLIYLVVAFLAFRTILSSNVLKGVVMLSIATAFTLLVYTRVVVKEIEKITQLPLIEFLEEHNNEDCYMVTNFKSYAPYFYGKVKPLQESDKLYAFKKELLNELKADNFNDLTQKEKASFNSRVVTWLENEPSLDKPTYIITRSHQDNLKENPSCKLLYTKGGYLFYTR